MTKGQISSAPKLTCLHVLFLLHNIEWYTMYRLPLPFNNVTANTALAKVFSSTQSKKYTSNLSIKVKTVSFSIYT